MPQEAMYYSYLRYNCYLPNHNSSSTSQFATSYVAI